jgi:uncharacterized repeat protein (TIGR03847 family)
VSESFDLPSIDRLTAGTVGPPGRRAFFLQVRSGPSLVSLKVEKVQVAALAQYLAERLSDLPPPAPESLPADLALEEPVDPLWAVGSLAISYDEVDDRVVIVAEELVDEEEEGGGGDRGVARFGATREQIAAFVVHAASVVSAGRPPCPLCGRPLDPERHVCVRANGHRTS